MGMRREDESEWRNMEPLYHELGSIGVVSQFERREDTGSPRLSLREGADTVLPSTFGVAMSSSSSHHHENPEDRPIVTLEERFLNKTAMEVSEEMTLYTREEWNMGVSSDVTAALCPSHDLTTVSPLIYRDQETGTPGGSPGVSPGVTPGVSPPIYEEVTGAQGGTPGVSLGVTPGVSPPISQREVTGTPGVSPGVTAGVSPPISQREVTGTPGVSPGVSPGVTAGVSPLVDQEEVTGTPGVSPGVSPGVTAGVSPLVYQEEVTGTPGVSPGVSPQIYQEEVTGTPCVSPGVSPGVTAGVSPPISQREAMGTPGVSPGVSPGVTTGVSTGGTTQESQTQIQNWNYNLEGCGYKFGDSDALEAEPVPEFGRAYLAAPTPPLLHHHPSVSSMNDVSGTTPETKARVEGPLNSAEDLASPPQWSYAISPSSDPKFDSNEISKLRRSQVGQ
ncbi:hypothetical protein GE061_004298 [Apolygus lucorum]|uniref:Uncharacterized protein n=1 Tax=Apolygus lucorum TaxID=248454 RepID=A0A8S9WYT2_APOLU|nr:hypothetical protein GE061_004298 [Apolygus lucorum]